MLQCAGFASFVERTRALGVSTSFLSRVRSGREPMSEHMQRRLSEVACSPHDLVMFAVRQRTRAGGGDRQPVGDPFAAATSVAVVDASAG